MDFIYQLINGLQVGSIYALVALGYTMVYGIAKLINFAHGDIIMVGAYIALLAVGSMNLNIWVALLVSVVFCVILGVLIERVAYKPLRNSSRMSALITAIGMSLFLENLFLLIFSSNKRPFPNSFSGVAFSIGDKPISFNTLLTITISLVLMFVLWFFVQKTKIGKAMRAVSEDTAAAQLMGININTTISVTFAIGSGLAAVASVFYSSTYPLVDPYMGVMLGLKAFIAAVLGGIGSIPGAILGGVIMGIAESLTKGYISSTLADAVVFGILILVLLFKPSGLLGKNVKEKV
ncbi:branched-chain amino acid ABC transporter permease [Acetanaerobacterium elongatum]|uniref:Amino acid/amide ABC transporter membrane protein 1, HAAT family n=1 Tax=Acetanaerobacterium elongatum TaxID=258515 RepID=A0A1H0FFS7_9FIRM|nr:branched-chain amino acid ABC transporter permease [Acetanaerobacterium elongatum]SDN93535.1 amino acid/amide ABC transporter membrane protein 1, HAAT family [Acetanaerobacterium elongatum]